MTAVHDYAGLVRLLFQLRVFPDDLGWTNLNEKEAAEIRSFGFEAAPGRSKVPTPLPPELVAGTPLENLSIGWEKFQADFLRASQVQKPAGQPSARDREVVDPPAPPRQREIAVQVLRKREANGNASHVNRQNPHARCGKRVPRSPWELIERRRPRKAAGEDPFEDMPEPARSEAPRIFARLCEKWDSKDPNWRPEKRWRKPLLAKEVTRMGRTTTNLLLVLIAGLLGVHLFVESRRPKVARYQWVKPESDKQIDRSVVLDTATGQVYTRSSVTVPAGVLSQYEVYEYPTGRTAMIGTLNPFEREESPRDLAKEACMERALPKQDAFQIIDVCYSAAGEARKHPSNKP